ANLLINAFFFNFLESFFLSINRFSVSKAGILLSLVTCKLPFFFPRSVTFICFIISSLIIPRYLTVSEDTPPLYINDSNPVPPPALICTDKNRSAPHLLASSVLLFNDTVLSVFLLIFTVTSL